MNRYPIANNNSGKKTIQILQTSRDYCRSKNITSYFDCFYLKPEEPQGRVALSVLKSNQLLFDERYKQMDLTVEPGFHPSCCHCKTTNYDSWKLVGVAIDVATQIVKLTLPLFMCELCFRKRFCYQTNAKYVCGIAVLPSVDNNPQMDKSNGASAAPATNQAPSVEKVVKPAPPIVSTPPILPNPVYPISPPAPVQPTTPIVTVQPSPTVPMNYGVEDVLETDPQDNTAQEEEEESPTDVLQDEVCFHLPFRQGGIFRTWLPHFFVLTPYSICMYPNEKRYEKKKKEIVLCDATVANSPVLADSKHKFCVSIQPGPCSDIQKPFVVALPDQEKRDEFIENMNRYITIAKRNQPEEGNE